MLLACERQEFTFDSLRFTENGSCYDGVCSDWLIEYYLAPLPRYYHFFMNKLVLRDVEVRGGRVVRFRTCDREVVGSNPTRGCCVPTPTQRAIPPGSVNEYQRKLGSKWAYHAMHWPSVRGLVASAGVRLRANETEISATPWARLGKGLYFTFS